MPDQAVHKLFRGKYVAVLRKVYEAGEQHGEKTKATKQQKVQVLLHHGQQQKQRYQPHQMPDPVRFYMALEPDSQCHHQQQRQHTEEQARPVEGTIDGT